MRCLLFFVFVRKSIAYRGNANKRRRLLKASFHGILCLTKREKVNTVPDITWELFEKQVEECRLCPLCGGIRHKVPGQGDRNAPLMLIGEGPGQVEDEQGLAFVGPAGQLLTRMLAAIQLPRDRVYICNIVKCRPPYNRIPTAEEAEAWLSAH